MILGTPESAIESLMSGCTPHPWTAPVSKRAIAELASATWIPLLYHGTLVPRSQATATEHLIKMGDSILTRKRDLVYLIFFIIHLPVMLGA